MVEKKKKGNEKKFCLRQSHKAISKMDFYRRAAAHEHLMANAEHWKPVRAGEKVCLPFLTS